MEHRQLEICCDSFESAQTAAAAGADRIELCVDLPVDGLTPPTELLREVKAGVGIPVFVLVRCRPGGFVFTDAELGTMLDEISALRDCGADGIVSGALRDDDSIDTAAAEQLVEAAGGLPFTFHKAFDACVDRKQGMEVLVELG
ncbi:MAG: copper homeostasis protein CutC, partial [Verrucomicrobiales bacterium]